MEFFSFAKEHGRKVTHYASDFILSRFATVEGRAAVIEGETLFPKHLFKIGE